MPQAPALFPQLPVLLVALSIAANVALALFFFWLGPESFHPALTENYSTIWGAIQIAPPNNTSATIRDDVTQRAADVGAAAQLSEAALASQFATIAQQARTPLTATLRRRASRRTTT